MRRERGEDRDLERADWEGMGAGQNGDESLQVFLIRVRQEFETLHNLKNLDDAVLSVVGKMDRAQKESLSAFFDEKKKIDFESVFKRFFTDEEWEHLEILERDRIMDFDRHESEGVG